jgi:hypothetical protein
VQLPPVQPSAWRRGARERAGRPAAEQERGRRRRGGPISSPPQIRSQQLEHLVEDPPRASEVGAGGLEVVLAAADGHAEHEAPARQQSSVAACLASTAPLGARGREQDRGHERIRSVAPASRGERDHRVVARIHDASIVQRREPARPPARPRHSSTWSRPVPGIVDVRPMQPPMSGTVPAPPGASLATHVRA